MKTKNTIGIELVIFGMILFLSGFSSLYYLENILLPPSEPPMMKSLEGTDLFLSDNRSFFPLLIIIGIPIALVGLSLLLWSTYSSWRKRK